MLVAIISSYFILFFGELIPKLIAIQKQLEENRWCASGVAELDELAEALDIESDEV